MTKYVRSIFVSAAVLLGLTAVSCSGLFEQRTSSVSITLPDSVSAASRDASISGTETACTYTVTLAPLSNQSQNKSQTKTGTSGNTITFDNVDAGTYTVSGTAYYTGEIYAQGTQTVDVKEGEQATVNLVLTKIPSSSTTDAAEPSITAQPASLSLTLTDGSATGTLSVTASTTDSGTLSYQWYSYTTASSSDGTAVTETTSSATDGTAISGATESSYKFTAKEAGTTYYYVIVTNTNTSVTGTQTATATSNVASVLIHAAAATLTSFDSAKLTNSSSYVLVGNTPALSLFTVTETYSDGTKQTKALTDSDTASYSVSTDYASDIGSVPVTITNTSLKTTQTITVPYKYEMPAYAVTTPPYAIYDAQYTGTSSFTAEFGAVKTYSVYTSGSEGDLSAGDTVSYQWYSNTTNTTTGGTEISGATLTTYTPPVTAAGTTYYYCAATYKPSSYYCTTSVSTTVTTDVVSAEVTAWTPSIVGGASTSLSTSSIEITDNKATLESAGSYTVSLSNTNDTSSTNVPSWSLTETDSDTTNTFSLSGNTLTAATESSTAARTATLTAKITVSQKEYILCTLTLTVPKTTTAVTSLSDLKTAIEAAKDTTTNTTVSISGTFNMSETSTTPSTITVAGNVTVIAGSDGCTITRDSSSTSFPLFTVSNGATLILGGSSSGALTIDGGYTSTTSISANAPLIQSSGALEISTNCTLQNNYYTVNGGAVYVTAGSVTTTPSFTLSGGTITGNYAKNGGGVYIDGGVTSNSNVSELTKVYLKSGTISNNTATANGGGLYLKFITTPSTDDYTSTVAITGNTSKGSGTSSGGGGIFMTGYNTNDTSIYCKLILNGETISSNTATLGVGGGIFVNGGYATYSSGEINDNTVSDTTYGASFYTSNTNAGFYLTSSASTVTTGDYEAALSN